MRCTEAEPAEAREPLVRSSQGPRGTPGAHTLSQAVLRACKVASDVIVNAGCADVRNGHGKIKKLGQGSLIEGKAKTLVAVWATSVPVACTLEERNGHPALCRRQPCHWVCSWHCVGPQLCNSGVLIRSRPSPPSLNSYSKKKEKNRFLFENSYTLSQTGLSDTE